MSYEKVSKQILADTWMFCLPIPSALVAKSGPFVRSIEDRWQVQDVLVVC